MSTDRERIDSLLDERLANKYEASACDPEVQVLLEARYSDPYWAGIGDEVYGAAEILADEVVRLRCLLHVGEWPWMPGVPVVTEGDQ